MRYRVIILLLVLLNVGAPSRVDGVYCDEVMETILEYQEETGAFSESDLEDLTGGCLRYEESVVDEVSK